MSAYLDYHGLKLYDEKIKKYIDENGANVKVIENIDIEALFDPDLEPIFNTENEIIGYRRVSTDTIILKAGNSDIDDETLIVDEDSGITIDPDDIEDDD